MDNGNPPEEKSIVSTDADEKRLAALSEFVVSLAQAFLRTGYYTSEHPESEKARAGLYAKFSELLLKKGELTFLAKDTPEDQQVLIEGMLPEPCELKALMFAGMAELYDEKLIQFLERKELISLTLKQKMEEEEFYHFIDIMGKHVLTDIRDKSKRDRFIRYLQEKQVRNISFIFNEDLIKWERNIPWRVWVALSRLRKDISLIPILRDLEQEELRGVKKEVVSDVLRPLKDPKLSFATLVNSDLIQSNVMAEEEIEYDIVDSLSEDMMCANVEEYIYSSSRLKETVNQKAFDEKLLRIFGYFKERLGRSSGAKSEAVLRKLYKNGMIPPDELPPKLREEDRLKKFLQTFLGNPDAMLTRLDETEDKNEYHVFMKSISSIMPWLIKAGRFGEFQKILVILKKCVQEEEERGEQAAAVLKQTVSGDIPLQLKERFMAGDKKSRLALYPLIRHLGDTMIMPLLAVIEQTQDMWVRKNAIELLLQMGPAATSHLQQALKAERFSGHVVANVIKTVVTTGNRETKKNMAPVVDEYCNHQDAHVRKHALSLLADARRINAEGVLLRALNDSDAEVRRTAITYLGVLKSRKALPVFLEILKTTMEAPAPGAEQIENQIYWALGLMDNDVSDGGTTPEEILLEVLKQRGHQGTISRLLRKKEKALSDQAIGVICDSLGKVGTKLSTLILADLAEDKKKPWASKAQQALGNIVKRF
ncbi:MAG: HEAT repeat domain-containing protein [Deltaproteobacteria bacterium]|nr:HEAT repeat domain-containing protein [Deltaproteobacteria bacterium]